LVLPSGHKALHPIVGHLDLQDLARGQALLVLDTRTPRRLLVLAHPNRLSTPIPPADLWQPLGGGALPLHRILYP
jgi:hypothetical protein